MVPPGAPTPRASLGPWCTASTPAPTPTPAYSPSTPAPTPTPAYSPCTGGSFNLNSDGCNAWQDFYNAMRGDQWGKDDCTTNPCGCEECRGPGSLCVLCDDNSITEIVIEGVMEDWPTPPQPPPTISTSIKKFTNLKSLSLVNNGLTGTLPNTLPDSLTKLKLYGNKFKGDVSKLNWTLPNFVSRALGGDGCILEAPPRVQTNYCGKWPDKVFNVCGAVIADGTTTKELATNPACPPG